MSKLTDDKYESFNKSLDKDFSDMDIQSKRELQLLMNQRGTYRVNKKYGSLPVKPKQIEHAWNYLNKDKIPTLNVKTEPSYYSTGYYKRGEKNIRYTRADRDIELDGKKYKKGWFIPRQD